MAPKLDPGFIAAPYYGKSSYDPVEAVKNIKLTEYQDAAVKQKKQADDMEKGLKDLSMEIKGWNDQQGFDEISGELENLRAKYVEYGNKGLNLARPGDIAEQKVGKAFHTELTKLKQKHDVWQEEKQRVDEATKIVQDQLKKPEEERDIDTEATLQGIRDWKETKGGVLERADKVNSIIVSKARPADVGKYVMDNIGKMVPGLDKEVKSWNWDATTNKFSKVTETGMSEPRLLSGMGKLLKNAPLNVKNAIEKEYQADPEKGVLSKEEWFRKRYAPEYPTQQDRTMTGGGTGTGGGYGVPKKDENGMYPVQPQVRDLYFSSKGDPGLAAYESVGRIPIGAIFGFKPISIIGSVNNTNTTTGVVEGKGKAIPAVPVEFNMLPVASKEMEITIPDPKDASKSITETFKPGDRIPKHVQDAMRLDNANAREQGNPPKYQTEYRPYVTMGLNYKQVKEGEKATGEMAQYNIYLDQTGRTQSYTETSIVPYDEVKKDLFAAAQENKQDWTAYDEYIQQLGNQLNGSEKMNSIFEDKTKSTDELFNYLEK